MHRYRISARAIAVLSLASMIASLLPPISFSVSPVKEAQAANSLTPNCTQKYRVAGDAQTNSPGNWTNIESGKNAFMSNPSGTSHWAGQTTNACVTTAQQFNGVPSPNSSGIPLGRDMLWAAFYAMVANDTNVGGSVRNELLALAAEPGLDFWNTTRWCRTGATNDSAPFWPVAIWSTRMLFAYDYLKAADLAHGTSILSAGNKTTLDNWFNGKGDYWTWLVNGSGSEHYVNRTAENYALTGVPDTTGNTGVLYYQGPMARGFHDMYNNRRASSVLLLGEIGIMLDNATYRAKAKRWWKEWLRYGVWPDGTTLDFNRWVDGIHAGWNYATGPTTQLSALAESLARIGDLELWNYSTSDGWDGTGRQAARKR